MTSTSLGDADRTTVPVRWTDAGWPTPLARAVVRSASGWRGAAGRAQGRSWAPPLTPARRDRRRLVGCAVVLVVVIVLVVLAAYGLGLWSRPGGPPKPAVAPTPAPATGGIKSP